MEKNISSKGEISPNMTKLGTHIKNSGNSKVFNKKKVWGDQGNDRKSRKNKKEDFCDPVVWFSMVVSSEVQPQKIIDQINLMNGRISMALNSKLKIFSQ